MFKKRSLALVLLLVACFSFTLFSMFHISKKNRRKYSRVLSKLQPQSKKHYGASKRSSVKKDVWVEKPDNLYHYMVISGDSVLHLSQMRSSQTHVVEEMGDITCYLQQKKYFINQSGEESSKQTGKPMQQICVLKMANGSYNYSNKKFTGQNAFIQIFQLPGHELTTKISFENATKILDGECDDVKFSLDDNKPNLRTQNLKAKVFTQSNSL